MAMPTRTNTQWIQDLQSEGERRSSALADLHGIILNGLPYALKKWLSPSNPRLTPLVEEAAQETLLRVMDNLDTFEGRSKFTTWVHKIAINIALTELRRKRWEEFSLDDLVDDEESPPLIRLMLDHDAVTPESVVEGDDVLQQVKRIILEELTDKQRKAMVAIAFKKVPLEEVARRMGTNRNALYKLMHDARRRLKHRLEREGLTTEVIFRVFENR